MLQSLGTDHYLVNAIVTSMLTTSENITENPAICPSGKCNFPPYTSLALCHSTEDITSQLINQTFNWTIPQFRNWFTLPGITVPTKETYLSFWTSTVWSYEDFLRTAGLPADKSALSLAFEGSPMDDVAHIYLAYNDPCLTRDREMAYYPEAWRAYKAKIRICLQTRSTTFNLSTSTSINRTLLDAPWERIVEDKKIETGTQTIEFWSAHMDGFTDNYTIGVSFLSWIGDQISRSFEVSSSFLHVTNGVTNAFLNANSSKILAGTSLRTTQYYNVEFWLLAFPVALFALVTIFFFITVLQTTRVPLWKSSQLAVLYTMSRPDELATKRSMENRAAKTRSEFAGDSWCLKESQAHVE
ncbi:hypothetical protein GRF29_216g30788 [Pseudopithomyces chartarum]|uniref:Uncharacterized protein n=1 Tax=Pseudopithomyces chartarum TaxID=1892770 RepID=A0AAN6RDY3_9PLEO|nr:hypothetical protein GRF29_216g30788 [Pseudopithomyces chartarum]